MKEEVNQILLEKFKEMSKIEVDDCTTYTEYACVCATMYKIAKILLEIDKH